jgi:hypothetical protein
MAGIKIYSLSCPISGEIKYIGKTTNSLQHRLNVHVCDRNKEKSPKSDWIKQLIEQGLHPIIEELECGDDLNSFDEKFWMSLCRSWGFKLLNSDMDYGFTSDLKNRFKLAKIGTHQSEIHILHRAKGMSKRLYRIFRNGKFIGEYYSLSDANRNTGEPNKTLSRLANSGKTSMRGITVNTILK